MFSKCDFRTVRLNDGITYIGLVRYNEIFLNQGSFIRPFVRNNFPKQIIKIGRRNYQACDQFIIAALNDYYQRISTIKSENERKTMLANYNRLYESWTILNQAKANYQYKIMEDSYDDISYQLYLLGYKMSNN